MARVVDKEQARKLRAQGKTYTEIKKIIGVGKGTLSVWLSDMPLSSEQMREVRDLSPRRIEHFRETMRLKREGRLKDAYDRAKNDIGNLSKRDLFIAGLYLYWGEGNKSGSRMVIANTDPCMIRTFLDWTDIMEIPKSDLRVRLHLYADMDVEKETMYWVKTLKIPKQQFRKPYIKDSKLSGLTYKTGHGHGTCNVHFDNARMWEYITMALKYIREQHIRP